MEQTFFKVLQTRTSVVGISFDVCVASLRTTLWLNASYGLRFGNSMSQMAFPRLKTFFISDHSKDPDILLTFPLKRTNSNPSHFLIRFRNLSCFLRRMLRDHPLHFSTVTRYKFFPIRLPPLRQNNLTDILIRKCENTNGATLNARKFASIFLILTTTGRKSRVV